MLSRLFNARLKSAEHALANGRIDDAFRLATAPDLADEARARKVLDQVGTLLFERAETHFKADRPAEALLDLGKAEQAGVSPERVADLRTIVRAALDDAQRRQRTRRDRLAAAQQRLLDGSLLGAERILERAGKDDPDARNLQQRAADRERRAARLFEEVEQYFKDNHMATAVARFKEARRLHAKDKKVAQWERVLVDKIVQSVQESLKAGRLNRAIEEMTLLSDIGDDRPAKAEATAMIEAITVARSALEAADYEAARRRLMGLEHLLSGAKWVKLATGQLKQIDELTTQVHGGPLGLVPARSDAPPDPGRRGAVTPPRAASEEQRSTRFDETLPVGGSTGDGSMLPERLLILVDGSGSYLLIRSPRASIGRAATERPADIPIISDLSERHADIARVEDDYFVFANREVRISNHDVRQKLLQNGDRIILGRRARLVFNLPSRKCTSAVLDLSGSGKLPNDVKRVIMFDRFAAIGRNTNSHIVVKTASEDLLLYERGGTLWVRHKLGGRGDAGVPVELGQPFEYAGVSMVVEPWSVKV